MQIELGARVRSHDHQDAGMIKNLILDPNTGHVKAVVVEKGLLLHEDVEVPLEALQADDQGEILLTYTAEEIKRLPHFDEKRYTQVPDEYARTYLGFPATGILWPAGSVTTTGLYPALPVQIGEPAETSSDERAEIEEQIERSNVVLSIGSEVISRDGEKVGKIDNIIFDSETGQPTALEIHRGLVFTQQVRLPATAVASIDDDVVYLNLDREQIDAAPQETATPMF